MKVILYMACSLDGRTTFDTDDTDWVSETDVERFDKLMVDCGVMIMGSKTYYSFGADLPSDKALQVVFTRNEDLLKKEQENVLFSNANPQEILKTLSNKGYSKVLLAGGAELNTSFLRADLIDEIRLIIKPLVLGKGKTLFNDSELIKEYRLTNVEKLSDGSLELTYVR